MGLSDLAAFFEVSKSKLLNVETQSSLSSPFIQRMGLEVLFALFFFPCWTILFRDILGLLKNSNFSKIGCWLGGGVPLRPSSALLPALNQVQSAGLGYHFRKKHIYYGFYRKRNFCSHSLSYTFLDLRKFFVHTQQHTQQFGNLAMPYTFLNNKNKPGNINKERTKLKIKTLFFLAVSVHKILHYSSNVRWKLLS